MNLADFVDELLDENERNGPQTLVMVHAGDGSPPLCVRGISCEQHDDGSVTLWILTEEF